MTFSLNVIAASDTFCLSSFLFKFFSAFSLASGLVPADPGLLVFDPFFLSSGFAGVWAELFGPCLLFALDIPNFSLEAEGNACTNFSPLFFAKS